MPELSERAKQIKGLSLTTGIIKEIEADKSGRVNEIFNAICEWQADNEIKECQAGKSIFK